MNLNRTHPLRQAAEAAASAGGVAAPAAPAVDAAAIRAEERARVEGIVALSRKFNVDGEKTQKMIADGVSIGEARGLVLDDMQSRGNGQRPAASLGESHVDLTDKEKRNYSVLRAVRAMVDNDWTKAGFEREVSKEISKRMDKETQGFFMPMNLPFAPSDEHARAWRTMGGQKLQTRAPYQVGTAGQGGNLVQTQLLADNFIEVLRNASVTAQLGALFLSDLTGNIDIPRRSGALSVGWVGESTAGSESEGTFDKVSLRPKTVSAWSVMSRLMMLQSTPSIEMLAREDLLAVAALAVDLAALSGAGSAGVPLGIVNQAGVGSVVGGTNGANITFDNVIQLKTLPRVANAAIANMAFAINSKTKGYLESLKATTGQYLWTDGGYAGASSSAALKGERYVESQQLRSTLTKGTATGICSEAIYGNWRELLIGMWGVMEIAVNPYDSTGFKNGDVILRIMQTVDVGVRHGASFAVMSDALTPGF
jgi:HK97 family phage major capsid protein